LLLIDCMWWIGIRWKKKGAKKPDIWQGNSLSIAGRTTLINSSLNNSTIYHMSMFMLPKTVIKEWIKVEENSFSKEGV
jgi:hypothetical protein